MCSVFLFFMKTNAVHTQESVYRIVNLARKISENIAWTRVNGSKCNLDFPNKISTKFNFQFSQMPQENLKKYSKIDFLKLFFNGPHYKKRIFWVNI